MQLEDHPDEILIHIVKYLNLQDANQIRLTSIRFYNIVTDWQSMRHILFRTVKLKLQSIWKPPRKPYTFYISRTGGYLSYMFIFKFPYESTNTNINKIEV